MATRNNEEKKVALAVVQDASGFLPSAEELQEIVHHLRKVSGGIMDDPLERISGSMGLSGAADAVLLLDSKRGEEDATLSVTSRDFDEKKLVVAMDNGRWMLKATNSEEYLEEQEFGAVLAVLGFLIKHLFSKIKREKQAREALEAQAKAETEALKDGMRSLLRRQIIADCKQAMMDGYCDETSRDTITAMYNAYHGLNGNGSVTDAYNAMRQLPLVPMNYHE